MHNKKVNRSSQKYANIKWNWQIELNKLKQLIRKWCGILIYSEKISTLEKGYTPQMQKHSLDTKNIEEKKDDENWNRRTQMKKREQENKKESFSNRKVVEKEG